MARYGIDSLNYMVVGRDRLLLNADTFVDYELSDVVTLAALERGETDPRVSCFMTEDGKYIRHAGELNSAARRAGISAFNAARFTPNRTFEAEFGQQGEDQNTLSGGSPFSPLYDFTDVAVKSAGLNDMDNFTKFDASGDMCEDIYLPQLKTQPVQFCGVNGDPYVLTEPALDESYIFDAQFQDGSDSYYMKLNPKRHRTYLYPALSSLSVDGLPVSSYQAYFAEQAGNISAVQDKIDSFFSPASEISVEYNHLLRMRTVNVKRRTDRQNWNEYRNGNVYADMYSLKNMYDPQYSMSMSSAGALDSVRKYTGLVESSGELFLKYYDSDGGDGVPYQKIERFNSVNLKASTNALHKTNFFSVRIRDTGLQDVSDGALSAVRRDIENAVRQIAKNVCPAYTQLFEVQFKDD